MFVCACCRNGEVRRTVEEIVSLVKAAPRQNKDVEVDVHACDLFRRHFSRCFYQVQRPAVLHVLTTSAVLGCKLGLLALVRCAHLIYAAQA